MNNDRLHARYSGVGAASYDAIRQDRPRWQAEIVAFSRFFERVKPTSVLDCPFGTGRWLPHYLPLPGPVVAVDISQDMLDKAREKLTAEEAARIHFVCDSALGRNFVKQLPGPIDLLVCTRFFNWLDVTDLALAMASLSSAGTRWAIIGASVRPTQANRLKTTAMEMRLAFENFRRGLKRRALQHVHDESVVLTEFHKNGWTVEDRQKIFENPTRENYFWLLRRG